MRFETAALDSKTARAKDDGKVLFGDKLGAERAFSGDREVRGRHGILVVRRIYQRQKNPVQAGIHHAREHAVEVRPLPQPLNSDDGAGCEHVESCKF